MIGSCVDPPNLTRLASKQSELLPRPMETGVGFKLFLQSLTTECVPPNIQLKCKFSTSAGEKAIFDCAVESDQPCTVTWLRNNRPLDDRFADRIQVVSKGRKHSLQMMNCRLDDSGLYTALAASEEGSTTCSASLVVQQRASSNITQLNGQFKLTAKF